MLTAVRLTLKVHRLEAMAAVVGTLVMIAAILAVRSHLAGVGLSRECVVAWTVGGGQESVGACEGPVRRFSEINASEAGKVMAAMSVLPFAVGLILGVPLVGRELEHRTATIAWSLSPSRRRWFLGRLLPVLALALILLVPGAVVASALAWERQPWLPPNVGFNDLALHGPIVVGRGLLALAVGVLAGAVLGRTLPAFIVAVVLCGALAGFLAPMAREPWMAARSEVVEGVGVQPVEIPAGSIGVAFRLRAPDGRLLSSTEAYESGCDPCPQYTEVQYFVPGSAYPELERLETGAWALLALGLLLIVLPVIERRRPG